MESMELQTVGALASGLPHATQVFEKFGIDYCCGGQRTLVDACATVGLALSEVVSALQAIKTSTGEPAVNWQKRSATELTHHILDRFHADLKNELPALVGLFQKVCAAHGENHAELRALSAHYLALKDELDPHMMKEERILFPAILALDNDVSGSAGGGCFGSIESPIRVMMMEHDNAGAILKEMRTVSKDYTLPGDACMSYKSLFDRLVVLERDLHEHIHLENNVLFPRAIELEAT
jgi:regulator of cell morphogenesis and NO signaling